MAAVFPIFRPRAIAAGLRYKAIAILLAASVVTARIRLTGPALAPTRVQDLRLPSRFARTFFRRPPTARVADARLEGSSRSTCVTALGDNGKLAIGVGELGRDTVVSLAGCDLHNARRENFSTELQGGASLSARNIFLSGGYTLGAGSVMSASRHLTNHTPPVADPCSRLEIPLCSGCTRTRYRLDQQRTETISPGVYCGGIAVAGRATLNPGPGTYILDRATSWSAAPVPSTGRALPLSSPVAPVRTMARSICVPASTIKVTAPARGAAAGISGIAIWVDGNGSATSDIPGAGTTQNINGAIYLPGRQVEYSGGSLSATGCNQLIARTITFTGNSLFRMIARGSAYPNRTRRRFSPSDPFPTAPRGDNPELKPRSRARPPVDVRDRRR